MYKPKGFKFSLLFAGLWLIFTLTLVIWWLAKVLSILKQAKSPLGISGSISKLENMILWEGVSLVLLIIVGAVPLIYLIKKEAFRAESFKQFFAHFSHDLKTSIASLRLQVECLLDNLQGTDEGNKKLLSRILSDTNRLQLQLNNSLYLTQLKTPKLFFEKINSADFFENLTYRWPHLKFSINGSAVIEADRYFLESLFNNLCQNSTLHGKARSVDIKVSSDDEGFIKIIFNDDGVGFNGEVSSLTKPFLRHGVTSGSGLGLFLIQQLSKALGGEFGVSDPNHGFEVFIKLKGVVL